MTYVPLITTKATADDYLFRNILRIVENYKVTNSNIIIQDTPQSANYPQYTLFIPTIDRVKSDMAGTNKIYFASMLIEFEAKPDAGSWAKCSELHQSVETGLDTEKSNLTLARIDYLGSRVLSTEPLEINGQQVFNKSVAFDFKLLL